MSSTTIKAKTFRDLHIKDNPLILFNIWDAGSAKIVQNAGAKAIALGSDAVAKANGYEDGEKLPLDIALHNLKLIIEAVNIPVSIDLESGYGTEPQQVANTALQAIELGAVGFNFEDQIIGENKLYDVKDQAARIAACRKSIDGFSSSAFINARTDVFLQAGSDVQIEGLLDEVITRAKAYHQAGADGLFVPGLIDEVAIKSLCKHSLLPVNIMMIPGCADIKTLSKLGVSRISYGPGPYQAIMELFAKNAKAIYT